MPSIKKVLDITSESVNDIGKLIEELRESPAAKGGNPGTDVYSSGGVQGNPYSVLSKSD